MYIKDVKEFSSRIKRCIRRQGINTTEELREYIKQYPIDEFKKYRAWYFRGIGDVGFKTIENYLRMEFI